MVNFSRLLKGALIDRYEERTLKELARRDRVTVAAIQKRRQRAAKACGLKLVRLRHPRVSPVIHIVNPTWLECLPARK
jgi:hypothetical protein